MNSNSNKQLEGLRPIPDTNRTFHLLSYILMWWASLIVIQAFSIGQGLLPPVGSLNFIQGMTAIILGTVLAAYVIALNGKPGMKWGIPYCIQVRATFGTRGAKLPELLRAIPAIIWYGIGTWIAALALEGIIKTLFEVDIPWLKYVYFFALQIIQTWMAYEGIKVMKWFSVLASIAMVLIMGDMVINIMDSYGLQIESSWKTEGSWGAPFLIGINLIFASLTTVMLNSSDLTRHLENKGKNLWLGHFIGVIPPFFLLITLGLLAGASVGIWDPIKALMALATNDTQILLLLIFIFAAQFTTNLTQNILPPSLIIEEIFKLRWEKSTLITGILGAISCPWVILGNAEIFFKFIEYYSAFLGPTIGCMLANYYLSRGNYNIEHLYLEDESSKYWKTHGFDLVALMTTTVVAILIITFFIDLSCLLGILLGFLVYLMSKRAAWVLLQFGGNLVKEGELPP